MTPTKLNSEYFVHLKAVLRDAQRRPKVPADQILSHVFTYDAEVTKADIDQYKHMNNVRYLFHAMMARLQNDVQTPLAPFAKDTISVPMLQGVAVRYRQDLKLGDKYQIQTRFAGFRGRDFVFEQRFVVDKPSGPVNATIVLTTCRTRGAGGRPAPSARDWFEQAYGAKVPVDFPDVAAAEALWFTQEAMGAMGRKPASKL